jgi:hypothetical protein
LNEQFKSDHDRSAGFQSFIQYSAQVLNEQFKSDPDRGATSRNFPCPAIAYTGVATEAALVLHRVTILRQHAQLYKRKRRIPGIQDPIEDVLDERSDFVLERPNAFIQRMVYCGFAVDGVQTPGSPLSRQMAAFKVASSLSTGEHAPTTEQRCAIEQFAHE